MLKEKLIQIGLSEYEATIYTFLLEKGPLTAQKIYMGTGINRVTTYNVLDSLEKKSLISSLDTEKKKRFAAESPKRLVEFLKDQKKELEVSHQRLEQNAQKLAEFLPDLEFVYTSSNEKPKVSYFEGTEGLRRLRQHVLDSLHAERNPSLYEVYSYEQVAEYRSKFDVDYEGKEKVREFLSKNQCEMHYLYTKKDGPQEIPVSLRSADYVYLNPEKYKFDCEVMVFGETTAILTPVGNLAGVLIENKDVTTTIRSLIQLAMKQVKSSDGKPE